MMAGILIASTSVTQSSVRVEREKRESASEEGPWA